jgi:hypothetical protein
VLEEKGRTGKKGRIRKAGRKESRNGEQEPRKGADPPSRPGVARRERQDKESRK